MTTLRLTLTRLERRVPSWLLVGGALFLLLATVLAAENVDGLHYWLRGIRHNLSMGRTTFLSRSAQAPWLAGLITISVATTALVPVRFRSWSHVLAGLLAVGVLLGPIPLLGLVAANLAVYLLLELPRLGWAHAVGLAGGGALVLSGEPAGVLVVAGVVLSSALGPLRQGRELRRWLSLAVVHAIPLGLFGIAAIDLLSDWVATRFGQQGSTPATAPLWLLLVGWQWWRLVLYRADRLGDKWKTPLSVTRYAATFLGLSALIRVDWFYYIGKGHKYVEQRTAARPHTDTLRRGAWLMLWGLTLLVLLGPADDALDVFAHSVGLLGFDRWPSYARWLRAGHTATRGDALFIGLRSLLVPYLYFAGLAHLKVAIWRLHGVDLDPHFKQPFLSTNLVTLWSRWFFYYREFLIRAFYWPAFFTFFKGHKHLRVTFATFCAAGLGNLIAHIVLFLLLGPAEGSDITRMIFAAPYYLLLGAGIAATQLWIMTRPKGRRKPWMPGPKVLLDIASVASVFLYLSVIRVFTHTWAPGHWETPYRILHAIVLGTG